MANDQDPTAPPPVAPEDRFYLGPNGGLGVRGAQGDFEIPPQAAEGMGLGGLHRDLQARASAPTPVSAPAASALIVEPTQVNESLGAPQPPAVGLVKPLPVTPGPALELDAVSGGQLPVVPPPAAAAAAPEEERIDRLPTDVAYPATTPEEAVNPVPHVYDNRAANLQNQAADLKETAVDKQANAELEGNQILSNASGQEAALHRERQAAEEKLLAPIREKYDRAIQVTEHIRDGGVFAEMSGGQVFATLAVAFLSGGLNPGGPNRAIEILNQMVAEKTGANKQLMDQLRQKLGDEKAAQDAALGAGLNALIKETDEKLKNVRDEQILAKWAMQRAELKDQVAALMLGAGARVDARTQQAIENQFKSQQLENQRLKATKGKGGGGQNPGNLSDVDPTAIYSIPGAEFVRPKVGPDGKPVLDEKGNEVLEVLQGINVAKGPGAAEVSKRLGDQIRLAKAYADVAKSIDFHYGYFRNLINDPDKAGAAQFGASLVAEIITQGGRALSDADREVYEQAMGPLKDPQKFFTLLSNDELKSLAHQARDQRIQSVKDLVGQSGHRIRITGTVLPVERKGKDNYQPSRQEIKESIDVVDTQPSGSRSPQSRQDFILRVEQRHKFGETEELITSPLVEEASRLAKSAADADLEFVEKQLHEKLEALKKEKPELYERTRISMVPIFGQIRQRLAGKGPKGTPTPPPAKSPSKGSSGRDYLLGNDKK